MGTAFSMMNWTAKAQATWAGTDNLFSSPMIPGFAPSAFITGPTAASLGKILKENPEVTRKLRAVWALHAIGVLNQQMLVKLLDHPSEHIRWWAIQFLCEDKNAVPTVIEKFEHMARSDSSPMVRL